MSKVRVLLADDHMLVLEGLQKILEQEFELVGIARDGYDLLRVASETDPDVILIDISMPLMNGLQAARELRKTVPRAKLIFLTMHDDPDYVTDQDSSQVRGRVSLNIEDQQSILHRELKRFRQR